MTDPAEARGADQTLNPATQYATDTKLAARQRLWESASQDPPFDLFDWVLGLAGLDHRASSRAGAGERADARVLDVGCGNGMYERRLLELGHRGPVIALDLSLGMLVSAAGRTRPASGGASAPPPDTGPVEFIRADAQRLPLAQGSFDVVLAPHMLYHVPDVPAAAAECRRVLGDDGVLVAVTNGEQHLGGLIEIVEAAVGGGWKMRSPAAEHFGLENGAAPLASAFDRVERVDATQPDVLVSDLEAVVGYVASIGDHYAAEVDDPWANVVDRVRAVAREALADCGGSISVRPAVGAFVCR